MYVHIVYKVKVKRQTLVTLPAYCVFAVKALWSIVSGGVRHVQLEACAHFSCKTPRKLLDLEAFI